MREGELSMSEDEILVTVGYEHIDLGLGLNEGKSQAVVTPVVKGVSTKAFGKSLNSMIVSVSHALDTCDTSSSSFEISDVELSLTINANGEVSLLSVADISAGAEAAVTVKLKRKNE